MSLPAAALLTLVVSVPSTTMTPDAIARYQQATQDIQARAYGPAIERLNALAAEYPRVAEIFASRCSALIANARYAHAQADCNYALSLKPLQPEALYALAVAEDHEGKAPAAAEHYRKYASIDGAPYQQQALARANALSSGQAAPMIAPGVAAPPTGARLIVYRNHSLAGSGPISLILDGHRVGDIEYGTYVEIDSTPGSHVLEARAHPRHAFDIPRMWTHPIQLNGPVYMNFDTSGGQIILQELPASQARTEIHDDCTRGWSMFADLERLPIASPAPVPQAPAVVVVPGRSYDSYGSYGSYGTQPYAAPRSGGGGNFCNSSIDCHGGGFCKDRGDGLKVCMDSGGAGAWCQSSIDCGGGLFCKDRGDGMNVCM